MADEDKIRHLPCWNGAIEIAVLSGGLSNANYLVVDAAGKHVVRFGVDYPFHHVFREHELAVSRAAQAAGFAPEVEYAVPGVMVTRYVNAKAFSAEDVKANAARVGTMLKAFHTAMPQYVTGPARMFWVFHVIRDYANTLNASAADDAKALSAFLAQSRVFEAAQVPLPIVFGHHDLLPANIMDDGHRLWLIDFEYAGFGTPAFDLAGVSSNAGMDAGEQDALLAAYFGGGIGKDLEKSLAAMACASLLRESLWAMVSSLYLTAPGVDYKAYAAENLTRYHQAVDSYQTAYGKIPE